MNVEPGQERARAPEKRSAPAQKFNGSGGSETGPAQELATLYPAARAIVIAGRSVEIKPCGIAQAGRIIDAGMPLYSMHAEGGASLLSLVEDEPQSIDALIVAATGFDGEWVASLEPLDKIDLVNEWLEVNGGFFFRRLLPKLARFGNAIASVLGVGRTSSTS